MADKKEKKVPASEVAGELRKAARLYEVFKHAADAASLLASFEVQERKLKSSINSLKKEHTQLDDKCNAIAYKIDDHKKTLSEFTTKIKTVDKEYQQEVRNIKQRATVEAAGIVASATIDLESLRSKITKAKVDYSSITEDVLNAKQELSDVNMRIEEIKTNALASLV